jgi:hypothetical protein
MAHRLILVATALGLKNFLTPAIRDDPAENATEGTPFEQGVHYLVQVGE